MHRTPFPKILALFLICSFSLCSSLLGQKKAAVEVDVTKCWSYPLGDTASERIASDGSSVFLAMGGAKVEALSVDGKKIWSSEFGGAISSNILVADSGLFLVTSTISSDAVKTGGSILRSISKETGITTWTLKLPDAERHFLDSFNGAVIVVSKNGAIVSIDAKNGNVKWKREITEGFVAKPAFTGASVIVATTGKQIFGVSLATGEVDSMRKVPYVVTALNAAANGETIEGDERGNVSALNGTDKPIWKFKTGGEISSIFAVGDHLLVTSHDNFVYFLVGRNGGRVWKKRLAGRVAQIANVMDRYALISSFEEHGAVLTFLSNGRVAGQIKLGEDETFTSPPIVSNGLIFALSNKTANAYSLNGCPVKK